MDWADTRDAALYEQRLIDDVQRVNDILQAEVDRLNQQIVDRDTTIMLEGETIERLRKALAEVMVPIEVLTAHGEDAWELAPEVRGELMTARTLGRAALNCS